MNEKPLPFVILENDKVKLNEEVLEKIKMAKNPRLLLFYGTSRQGKSTTLNQLIKGNNDTWKFINKSPFLSRTSEERVTEGCDIFGPIRFNELVRRHNIGSDLHDKIKKEEEDFDIFFCDTEGLYSIQFTSKLLIPGVLTLLQVCTLSVIMISNVPNAKDLEQISSEFRLGKFLQLLNPDLKSPLVSIYIANYQIEIDEDDDYDELSSKYQSERDKNSKQIFQRLKQDYPDLNVTEKDFQVIPGGPYEANNNNEPDHDDIKVRYYWESIHNIFNKSFCSAVKKKINEFDGKKLDALIRIVFDVFKNYTELPDKADLTDVLKKLFSESFENYSNDKLQAIENDIKRNILTKFEEYLEILNNDNSAKKKIQECIDNNLYEVYNSLIPDKIIGFINTSIERIRAKIKDELKVQINNLCDIICADENIYEKIKDKIELINNANFMEEINLNEIDENYINNLWEKVFKDNEKILTYYKEKSEAEYNNLHNIFISKISEIFKNLLSKKIKWSDYLKKNKDQLREFFHKIYEEDFLKCKYKEDFKLFVHPPEALCKQFTPTILDKHFNIRGMTEEKKSDVKNLIFQILKEEYNNLHGDKLPSWNYLFKNLFEKVQGILKKYLEEIFFGKYFKDQIDPKLGTKEELYKLIPNDIIENEDLIVERKNQMTEMIRDQVNNAKELFNSTRNQLPLFSEFIESKKNLCINIVNQKMNEILPKFYYFEDKILFNQDTIKSLIMSNPEVFQNIGNKINEINAMINTIAGQKSQEYDLIVERNKPKWNEIKEEKITLISSFCNKIFENLTDRKKYKDEMGSLNLQDIKKQLLNINGLYNKVEGNRKNELNKIIDMNLKELEKDYNIFKNNLPSWTNIMEQKIQTASLIMERLVNNALLNYEYKEDALNNKLTSANLYDHVNLLPKFYDGISEKKIIELQRKFKELSNTYEKTYLTLANKKKSRDQENKKRNEETRNAVNQARNEFKKIQKALEEKLKQEEIKRQQLQDEINRRNQPPPQPQPNNQITVGSRWLFTGYPQVNSYGNGGHGRYFNNHNVYIVGVKGDGRAFPYRLGDNNSTQFGWANAGMLHH